ncbi:MAG: tRNA (adenosine(37)-N6)-threonylcarbamoyltransferase complex transferase subunit TsaD [Candidatus Falkowbacteria bacterium]
MKILAIETSCDETAAAVVAWQKGRPVVLSNIVSSQIAIHQKYGGVVPEIAAREHVLNILPVIEEALLAAGITRKQAPKKLAAIAVTAGPGLITSLMMGVETARSLAVAWDLPLIDVNHIEGHMSACWLGEKLPELPAVVMTVSGGHNMLVLIKEPLKYKILGDTRDDAAGEAFDKAAKILGLGYPGGPAIAASAATINNYQLSIINERVAPSTSSGQVAKIVLPRPMINSGDFDFSFSGLKTALLYQIQKDSSINSGQANWQGRRAEYAAEFQSAVADTLVSKTIKAAKKFGAKTVMLSGGVSANKVLRAELERRVADKLPGTRVIIAPQAYTTDNAAMIGAAALFRLRAGKTIIWSKLKADPNLEIK